MTEEKSVHSIERAFDIIEDVAVRQNGTSLTDIATRVNLHKSTVHRIISTLLQRGYLEKTDQGNYKLGLRLIDVVSHYINNLELQTEARSYIADIAAHVGLTCNLGVLDGDKVVHIERVNMNSLEKLYFQIGDKVNAYCSSLGKCLLSNYSKKEIEDVMADCSFIKFTPNTISDMESLQKEVSEVRSRGWALDDEECEAGQRCIGAPIYDYRGDIIAAVSVSGDKHILTDDRIEEISGYLVNMAMKISSKMGYVE